MSFFAVVNPKYKTRNQYEEHLFLNWRVEDLRDDLKEMGVHGYTKGKKGDVVKILGGIKYFGSRRRTKTEQKEYIERYNNNAKRRKGKPKGRTACTDYKIYKEHLKVGGKKIKCKPLRNPPTRDHKTKRCRFCEKQRVRKQKAKKPAAKKPAAKKPAAKKPAAKDTTSRMSHGAASLSTAEMLAEFDF